MKTIILGVSFSSRMFGLAVLQSGGLTLYHVKHFKESWSPAKMNRILTSLASVIEDNNIKTMVLSIPPVNYQEGPFQELWQEVVFLAKSKNLFVKMYKQSALQLLCGTKERMTRKSLMETLVLRYPELEIYANWERRSKNKYYYKLFEAIGVATMYENEKQD